MKKITFIFIALLIGFGGYFSCKTFFNDSKGLPQFHRVVKKGLGFEKWTSIAPKDENFSASFPKKPKTETRALPIPGSDDSLPYKEFKCELEGGRHFSVSYTTLPETWTQYGNSLVLGGALKVIMHELGKVELVGKKSIDFKSFPGLDYEHYSATTETAGTLVLVNNILYKVEMTYPLEKHNNVQDELSNFIENFSPSL